MCKVEIWFCYLIKEWEQDRVKMNEKWLGNEMLMLMLQFLTYNLVFH